MQRVDLTLSRQRQTPAEDLAALAATCTELGVETHDVYGDFGATPETSWLRKFEAEVAAELGLEDAVFMPSGVMAQEASLCIYREQKGSSSFVCHYSSHLLLHEKDGYKHLLGMTPVIIPADSSAVVQQPVTFAAVAAQLEAPASATSGAAAAASGDAADGAAAASPPSPPRPCVVVVECPHREVGGKITPWEDLVAISALCRRLGVGIHMDGARLWEASAAYGRPLPELCALFDSVYVSFYKGLGGMTGAMLLGSKAFAADARVWLRRFGGNLFSLLPYAVSAWSGFRRHKGDFAARRERMQAIVARLTETFIAPALAAAAASAGTSGAGVAAVGGAGSTAAAAAAATAGDGGGGGGGASTFDALAAACAREPVPFTHPLTGEPLLRFDPPVPVVSLVHVHLACDVETALRARDAAAAETGVVCFSRIRPVEVGPHARTRSYFEFNMGPLNGSLPEHTWSTGWEALLTHLQEGIMMKAMADAAAASGAGGGSR